MRPGTLGAGVVSWCGALHIKDTLVADPSEAEVLA